MTGPPYLPLRGCSLKIDHVADRLLIQLQQLRNFLDRQEFIWHGLNLTEPNGRLLARFPAP